MRTTTDILLLAAVAVTSGCSSAANRFDRPYVLEVSEDTCRAYVQAHLASDRASPSFSGFDGKRLQPFVEILRIRALGAGKMEVTQSMAGWGGDENGVVYTAQDLGDGFCTQTYWGSSFVGKRWRGMGLKWPRGKSLEVSIADSFGNTFTFSVPHLDRKTDRKTGQVRFLSTTSRATDGKGQ